MARHSTQKQTAPETQARWHASGAASASHEALSGFRDATGLLQRGRWLNEKSVRRYAKGGRVNQVLDQLPDRVKQHALDCERIVGRLLSGSCAPLRPPRPAA